MLLEGKETKLGYSIEVVAELACGHSGDPQRLIELTTAALTCNVSAVKYQIFDLNERAEKDSKAANGSRCGNCHAY